MTSPIGRTVGSTWSLIGTSLTVYFSRVVTFCFSAELADAPEVVVAAVVVADVESAGGGVDD
jgi:cytochrome c oxidase assembly protein Cox11